MSARVTIREVAAAAGVSVFTVSLALRGSGRVAAGTRERVVAAARALGYERDAAAAMLVGRRHGGGGSRVRIGLISADLWSDSKVYQALARAAGYDLANIGQPQIGRLKRVLSVEWHRGMQGLLINLRAGKERAYLEEALQHGIAFEQFSVVGMGPGPFSSVRDSAWQAMSEALGKVLDYGYGRIAVLLGQTDQVKDDDARLAAVLLAGARAGRGVVIENRQFPVERGTAAGLAPTGTWLRAYRPDAVVIFPGGLANILQELGFAWPRDFGLVGVPLPSDPHFVAIAGILDEEDGIRRSAIELLDQQLRLGIRGIPVNPVDRVLHLPWRDGPSLPRRVQDQAAGRPGGG